MSIGLSRVTTVVGSFLIAIAALTSCSESGRHSNPANTAIGTSAPTAGTSRADENGLVAARHRECNFGRQLMAYLATGENGGDPWYDQHFADYVGVSVARARAITDDAIQDCDKVHDEEEAAASASAAYTTSRQAEAAADAALSKARKASCEAVGGTYIFHNFDSCRPPAGHYPNGSECMYIGFDGSELDSQMLANSRELSPECWIR